MKVYGQTKRQEVYIEPLDVIEGLIDKAIGVDRWVKVKDGVCFRVYDASRVHEIEEEISQELYDHVQRLYSIKEYLKAENE